MIRKLVKGLELDFSRKQHTLGVPDTLSQKHTKNCSEEKLEPRHLRNRSKECFTAGCRQGLRFM